MSRLVREVAKVAGGIGNKLMWESQLLGLQQELKRAIEMMGTPHHQMDADDFGKDQRPLH